MAGCGDQSRGIPDCSRIRGASNLGVGNLSEFFYGTQSVAVAGGQVDRTPSPPVCLSGS